MELNYSHLLGKTWEPGRQDCFALSRAFFADNFDIPIRNYARPQNWDSDQIDLITATAWEREGFEGVHDWDLRKLQPADVLVMAVGASNANHLGIYVGGNSFIHHLVYRNSEEEVLRDFWRNATLFVLRHPAVPDLRPQLPTVNLKELISARYSPQAEA